MNEDKNEIMFLLGKAVWCSQLIETTLSDLIFVFENKDHPDLSKRNTNSRLYELSAETLGTLYRLFKNSNNIFTLDDRHKKTLGNCIDARNFLIHNLIKDPSLDIQIPEGRQKLITKIQCEYQTIKNGSDLVQLLLSKVVNVVGGDLNEIENEVRSNFNL